MNRLRDGKTEAAAFRFSPEIRQRNVKRMGQDVFDVLVIGGGITGAGIARDAALRGFKTALIEKDDFGAGTSSKSSKLVHGGFRYLKQLQFGLVHEALRERKTLRSLAPHLVHPMKCLLSIHQGLGVPVPVIQIALWLYDFLAFDRNIDRHRMLSAERVREMEPEYRQEGLRGTAEYYDCWGDDFRLVLSTIQSAAQYGAASANYIRAIDLMTEKDRIATVVARDHLSGGEIVIRSRVVATATGAWSDHVRQTLLNGETQHVRTTKGVHIVVSQNDLPVHHALVQFAVQDGRPVFAIPWNHIVLLGNTDTDYDGDLDQIRVERADVDYLLESFNYYFPKACLTYDHILSTFAGLRPLVSKGGIAEPRVSREYRIFEGPGNYFSIIGGKLTSYRAMAKHMVDRLARRLEASFDRAPKQPTCITGEVPLWGGDISTYRRFHDEWISRLTETHRFEAETAIHLIESYGTNLPVLLTAIENTPDGIQRIHPHLPYVWGELTYAIDYEMAMRLDDFLTRRAPLFSLDSRRGIDVCGEVANRMEDRLGWSAGERLTEIDRYQFNRGLTEHFRKEMPHENTVHR